MEGIAEAEAKEFLNDLAVVRNVASSTQNQAFSALMFLFKHVLQRPLRSWMLSALKRPKQPASRLELGRSLTHHGQLGWQQSADGSDPVRSGLRIMELLRLRIKDIDFDQRQIIAAKARQEKIASPSYLMCADHYPKTHRSPPRDTPARYAQWPRSCMAAVCPSGQVSSCSHRVCVAVSVCLSAGEP